jgi:hypothetical protein
MSTNLINQVNRIRDEYLKGAEDGLDEKFYKQDVPFLFARIEELERSLVPFAHVAESNKGYNKPLINVYHKDCVTALDMVLTSKSVPLPRGTEEYPAE